MKGAKNRESRVECAAPQLDMQKQTRARVYIYIYNKALLGWPWLSISSSPAEKRRENITHRASDDVGGDMRVGNWSLKIGFAREGSMNARGKSTPPPLRGNE